jgi:hypothetical protein
MTGASQLADDIDAFKLMDVCLAENARRLGVYDKRLKRPRFVPFMVRIFRRLFGPKPDVVAA